MRQPIRVAVVDNHPQGRKGIRALLGLEPDIEVVAEYSDARTVSSGVAASRPDLLFLDLYMSDEPAFSILECLGRLAIPALIVIAPHARYALKAFEVSAVDYLLRPFDEGRFRKSLERARHHLAAMRQAETAGPHLTRLAVRTNNKIRIVQIDSVEWIAAAGNYICLHAAGTTHHYRDTISNFETKLDPSRFVRIHRSAIANIDQVAQLEPVSHNEHLVVLRDGTRLKLTPRYRDRVETLIGHF